MTKNALLLSLSFLALHTTAQETPAERYEKAKRQRLAERSPFEKIVAGEAYAPIVYEDSLVIAFAPIRYQAPVHYLIVPKKRIATVNDITEADALTLGRLFLAAKAVAQKAGIADSGFRLTVNTNRDAGQSVFHLHMHLVGGAPLGSIADGSAYTPAKAAIQVSAASLASFVGQYQLPSKSDHAAAFVATVRVENGKLFLQIGEAFKTELLAQSETKFSAAAVVADVEFVKRKDGKVEGLVLRQAGMETVAMRMD